MMKMPSSWVTPIKQGIIGHLPTLPWSTTATTVHILPSGAISIPSKLSTLFDLQYRPSQSRHLLKLHIDDTPSPEAPSSTLKTKKTLTRDWADIIINAASYFAETCSNTGYEWVGEEDGWVWCASKRHVVKAKAKTQPQLNEVQAKMSGPDSEKLDSNLAEKLQSFVNMLADIERGDREGKEWKRAEESTDDWGRRQKEILVPRGDEWRQDGGIVVEDGWVKVERDWT
jgi:hypothetical protein